MNLLRTLQANGAVRAVDHALAASLRRLDPATPDAVLAAAALVSRAVAEGHSGFRVAEVATLCDAVAPQREAVVLPDAESWVSMLRASRWVADADAGANGVGAPLVLEGGRLYLRRYWNYEVRLANALRNRARPAELPADDGRLRARFTELFAAADAMLALAALLALSSKLAFITGGPGTGKTSTVAALLVLLHEQARLNGASPPRIALAAPTGKAAARLAEALAGNLERLRADGRIEAELAATLRVPAQTLHRLLGWRADSVRFRHDTEHPLRADVVVVDEASMVDLPLMCKLVEAVAPEARLVLLGDRDQLASVETGDVLAALCDAAGDGGVFPPAFAAAASAWIGASVAAGDASRSVLAGHRVELVRSHRQDAGLDMAPLATAVRLGDAEAALAGLRTDRFVGVRWHDAGEHALPAWLREHALLAFRAIAQATEPRLALQQARALRILTAVREGPAGSEGINAWIANALQPGSATAFFHGRLLIVTENSYRQGLFNGDTGVVLEDATGAMKVWFDTADGPHGWAPGQLPAHASAWALTVHKAQGSEFERVLLALPDHDARVLGRELLYTGITRCRRGLDICAREDVLRIAIERRNQRESGLSTRFSPEAAATG